MLPGNLHNGVGMGAKGAALLLCLVGLCAPSLADCKKAGRDQVPQGANEIVILRDQNVGRLQGVVSIGFEGQPGRGVVVEVYRYNGEPGGVKTAEFLQTAKPSVACLTNARGAFEFPRLKPGQYLLIAGTVKPAGINEARMIVRITRGRGTQKIRFTLTLGT